jgi:hypothetical protein
MKWKIILVKFSSFSGILNDLLMALDDIGTVHQLVDNQE